MTMTQLIIPDNIPNKAALEAALNFIKTDTDLSQAHLGDNSDKVLDKLYETLVEGYFNSKYLDERVCTITHTIGDYKLSLRMYPSLHTEHKVDLTIYDDTATKTLFTKVFTN